MNARDLLLMLQHERARSGLSGQHYDAVSRERYLAAMKQADPATRRYMEQNLERMNSRHAEYMSRLPTPDQSVQDYVRLTKAKERLDVTLRGGGDIPPRNNVVIGSVETEHLNALSTHCGQPDEYLIVFNRALLTAFLRICNYMACVFIVRKASDGSPDVPVSDGMWPVEEIDDDVVLRLAPLYRELLAAVAEIRLPDPGHTLAFIGGGDAREAEFRSLRWQAMEDFVTEFVFAHEYIHVLLNHLTRLDDSRPTEDHGGWGHEYEADSVGLELLIHTWMNELRADPVIMTWLFQSVGLFFIFTSQVERYVAEVLGRTDLLWRDNKSHPPTWVRYTRLAWEISRYPYLLWPAIHPHLRRAEDCLEQIYGAAVGTNVTRSAASLEWRFQRLAFESLGLGLLPQHLFVVARAVKSTLKSGTPPDRSQLEACTTDANLELNANGVYPLADVTQPLAAVVSLLGNHALDYSRSLEPATVNGFADELARVALRDARTRYPSA